MNINKKKFKLELESQIVNAILDQPKSRFVDIAKQFGVSEWYVNALAKRNGVRRKRGAGSTAFPPGLQQSPKQAV
jgi:hypothetical protein